MADPIKVTKCSTENTDLLLPSHVDLVEGLDTRIQDKITSHYNTTVTAAISALSNTYLGKNANAVSATKATNDGDGNKISTTYYKKTDTVTNAANAVNATNAVNDSNGNNIIDTYVTKTDVVANATNAVHATYADYDSSDVNARNSIRDYFIGVSTNDNHSITFSRGSGQSVKLTIADTTYNNATTTTPGLMSAADKTKLDGIEANAQAWVYTQLKRTTAPYYGDLNNLKDGGVWWLDDYLNWNHRPAGPSGSPTVLVFNRGINGALQLMFEAGTSFWYRNTFNDVWQSWVKVAGTIVDTVEL